MKNIAVLSHWGFDQLHGGNLRAYFLIKTLLANNHTVTIVCANKSLYNGCIKQFGQDIKLVHADIKLSRFNKTFHKIYKYIIFGYKIRNILNSLDIDAVIGFNLIHALPIIFQNKSQKYVYYVDYWSDFFQYDINPERFLGYKGNPVKIWLQILFSKIIKYCEFYTMQKADKIVMVTDTMKNKVPVKINKQKISVIPDGADIKLFSEPDTKTVTEFKTKYSLHNKKVISYQGGIAPHEGLQFLVDAAPEIILKQKDTVFFIAGSGEFLEVIKRKVKQLNLSDYFIFTGWLDYKNMPSVLALSTISVVPMPKAPSATIISLKLLEGLAAGTPLIVNDISGIREIVTENEVWFTDVENPGQFAQDIIKILNTDNEIIQKKINNGLVLIKNYDWQTIAEKDYIYFFQDKTDVR